MSDKLPDPEIYDGVIDDETLARWVDDLSTFARVDRVMEKGGATRHAGSAADVRSAADRLRAGEIRGIQAWYQHDGNAWCDTVLPAPGGWRVVRMRLAPDLQ